MSENGSNTQEGQVNPSTQQAPSAGAEQPQANVAQQAQGTQQNEGADSHQGSDSPQQSGDIGSDGSADAGDSAGNQPGATHQTQQKGDQPSQGIH